MTIDTDECAANETVCGPEAKCNNTFGSYSCSCAEGYEGDYPACAGLYFLVFLFISHTHILNFMQILTNAILDTTIVHHKGLIVRINQDTFRVLVYLDIQEMEPSAQVS